MMRVPTVASGIVILLALVILGGNAATGQPRTGVGIVILLALVSLGGLVIVFVFRRLLRVRGPKHIREALVCRMPTGKLQDFLEGRLPEADQAALADHLGRCPKCQERVEILEASQDAWSGMARQLRQPTPAPEPALKHVMDKLKGEVNMAETTDLPQADDDLSLSFLTPSEQPGHLGRLGPYEIQEVIGRGGMGIVLKAFDPSLQRVVAIKVLAPHLATSAAARRRFTREAQAAAAVSHDHVVTIHAVEENHRPPYLVMQYIAGMSLQQRLEQVGQLGLKEILRIGMQTAAGLAAAHAQGLIHRDIKPANILLENGLDRVKITDFGLARAADDASVTQSGFVPGTPQYMAPEQARGEPLDHRADLFSLGSTLYAACTGRPPFRASSTLAVLRRVSDDTPRPIKELNPDIPTWLAAIIEKLHAKNPANRFQSAAEVAELFGRHLAQIQQPSWVPPTPALSKAPVSPLANGNGPVTSLTICPLCSCHLHVPDRMVGKLVDCPQCHKPFRVEDASEELYIVRMDPPAKVEPQRPSKPVRPVRPAAPRRRTPRWALVLGLLALLFLGLVLFSMVGYHAARSSHMARVAEQQAVMARSAANEADRSHWGLDWFPADATCFGAINLTAFRRVSSADPLVQTLTRKYLPNIIRQVDGQFGTWRLDRASFAAYNDPLTPGQSRLFIRLTGQASHKQLAALLKKMLPNAVVETHQLPPWHVPITLLTSAKTPWGVVLIGDHDVVLARYVGDDPWEGGAQGLLEQVLRVREGMELALPDQPSQSFFGSAGPSTRPGVATMRSSRVAFLEGKIPDALKKWPDYPKWLPLTPLHVALEVTHDQRTKIQCVLTPVKAGDERALLENANRAKQQALQSLNALLADHPNQRIHSLVSRSLSAMSFYFIPPGTSGGAPRGQSSTIAATSAVGGTWILSPEEVNAFENLLMSLP